MAKLFITLADSGQMTHQLAGAIITIGRYPDNMIQINHASVSGHHARLVSRNGRYRLQDLNSSPRSYLNGMPSSEADLPDSCVLRFGTVECVFKDEVNASPIDQYVSRLADSQRQVDTVIRARDFLHQQVQDLQKKMEDSERAGEERGAELEELRKQVSALTQPRHAPAPNGNDESGLRLIRTDAGAKADAGEAQEVRAEFEKLLEAARQAAAQSAGQLAEARAQVERLQGELEAASQGQSGAAARLENALQERDAASARLAEALEKSAGVARECDALRQGSEALSKALSHAKQQIEAVAGDRDAIRKEREELAAGVAEHRRQAELLGGQDKALGERLEEVSAQLREAQEKVEALTRERAEQEELTGALRDAGRQEHAQWVAGLEARQQEASFLEGQRNALAEELRQASARLAEAVEQNEALARDRADAEKGHEGLSEALNSLRQQADAAAAEREAWREKFEEASRQLDEARDEARQAAEQQAARMDEVRLELEAATLERDAERGVRQEHLAQMEVLGRERHELAAERDRLAAEQSGLQSQLEENRATTGSSAEEVTTLQQENEILTSSVAELREQLDSLARMRGSNRQEIEAIRLDRDSLKQQQADWSARLEEMTRQLASVTDERNRHRAANEHSAAAIAETEDRLKAMTRERDATVKCAHELEEAREQAKALGLERDTLRARCEELTAKQPKPADNAKALEQFHVVLMRKEEEIARLKQELAAARTRKPSPAELSLVTPVESPDEDEPPASPAEKEPGKAPAYDIGTGMRSVPSLLSATRNRLHYFIRHPGDDTIMSELAHHIREIKEMTGNSNLETSQRLANVLNGMMEDVVKRPEHVTPGLLRTFSQSVDFLITLQEPKAAAKANVLSRGNIFVVDDDPGILDAIVPTLEEASLQVSCSQQARKALKILADQKFDLVLLDVGLPEMNGMDLCAKIRGIPHQRKTPIVFLTGMDTVQNRVQSMLSGGNDFIGKPFNTWELAAKSLIWALKSQLALI